jgi:hypothetical protein
MTNTRIRFIFKKNKHVAKELEYLLSNVKIGVLSLIITTILQ